MGKGVRLGGTVFVGTGVSVGISVGVLVGVKVGVFVGVKVRVGVQVGGNANAATLGAAVAGRKAAIGFAPGLIKIRPKQRQMTTVRPMTPNVAY